MRHTFVTAQPNANVPFTGDRRRALDVRTPPASPNLQLEDARQLVTSTRAAITKFEAALRWPRYWQKRPRLRSSLVVMDLAGRES
jgi:hypothetical protein